ncbi:MAG: alpha/beta hydrolase [Microcella pacifica]|uniref:alpha/beta fold hydrolase n=1 Tax=Microcella pacifica TaxID=2591847 RepID=UPI003315FAFF
MNIVLIPGFWLDGASWSGVTPTLARAGHTVHTPTLPGKRPGDRALSGIGLHDHVDAVLEIVDAIASPVVLVGHSGGGSIAWAAADARPADIARVVFVDALLFPDGSVINDELPVEGDRIPLPEWNFFEAEDLVDLDDALRERFRAIAVPEPAAVATDPQTLHHEARFAVPVTVIACEFPEAMLRQAITSGAPWASELGRLEQLEIIELPTGHWPQFTKPVELGQSILAAVERA